MKKILLSVLASMAFLFTVAAPGIYAPELVAPADNATGAAPNVLLDWNAVAGQLGLSYEVQLSDEASFANPLNFATEFTSYRMSELLFGHQYFWRVRAKDNSGTSDWSASRSFTVLDKTTLASPANDAKKLAPNVKIRWNKVGGATHYDYQMDVVSTFDSPYAFTVSCLAANVDGAGTTAEIATANLLFGEKHYWRVRARHALDTSDWSASRFFTVIGIFENLEPENAASGLSPDVLFEWKKIDGLQKYSITMATDNQFMNEVVYDVASNLTEKVVDTLQFGTQYFWKFSAIHALDTLTEGPFSFSVVNKVSLSAPANNATNIPLVPTLEWNKISGVLTYVLELSSSSSMSDPNEYHIAATTTAGTETFKIPVNVLDSAATYYWRVKAISSRDTSEWSNTWSFPRAAGGIDDQPPVNGIRIYPSPAAEQFSIQLKPSVQGKAMLTLYDLLGKVRLQREVSVVNGAVKNVALGTINSGIYMLKLESQGTSYTSKIIVRK